MHRVLPVLPLTLALTLPLLAGDWPQFRGPTGQGHADGKPPTEWGPMKNVTWRKELPGKGWSSPVVVGGKVFVTTGVEAEGQVSLRVIRLDARTGNVEWDHEVFRHPVSAAKPAHGKNSFASPTPFADGGRLFVHFGHLGTACLEQKDGAVVWSNPDLKYQPVHGNGGSPVVVGDKLVFSIDGTDRQEVVALDKATGKVAWTTPRNAKPAKAFSFGTPLVITVNGKDQLISQGSDVVMSLDPTTGKEIWRFRLTGYSVVPRPVFGNGLLYLSCGFDTAILYAIRPDGTGDVTKTHVAWTAKGGAPHSPSPLLVGDALYTVTDKNGLLTCLDAKTGEQRWQETVGGLFTTSPTYAGGFVYLIDEAGTATVFKPGPAYEWVATNKLGEKTQATPAVDGDALLLRTEKALYRIEKK